MTQISCHLNREHIEIIDIVTILIIHGIITMVKDIYYYVSNYTVYVFA